MARMLTMDSYPCEIAVIGNVSHATEEWKLQCHICEQMKIPIRYDIPDRAYIIENRFSVLVDAMLGTGLSRLVSGSYEQAIQAMNAADTYRVAVDIPSGISGGYRPGSWNCCPGGSYCMLSVPEAGDTSVSRPGVQRRGGCYRYRHHTSEL